MPSSIGSTSSPLTLNTTMQCNICLCIQIDREALYHQLLVLSGSVATSTCCYGSFVTIQEGKLYTINQLVCVLSLLITFVIVRHLVATYLYGKARTTPPEGGLLRELGKGYTASRIYRWAVGATCNYRARQPSSFIQHSNSQTSNIKY